MAISGDNFCSSAFNAFMLVLRNAGRFAILSGIGEIFVAVGRIAISLLTALIGYLIINNVKSIHSQISSSILPTMVPFSLI